MNQILKERNATIRNNLIDINHSLELIKTKMGSQEKYITDLNAINKDQIQQKKDSMETHSNKIKEIFKESKKLGENLTASLRSETTNYEKQIDQIADYKSHDNTLNNSIKKLVQDAKFYEENDECPTCDQPIEESKKTTKIDLIKREAGTIQQEKQDLDRKLSILNTTTKSINQSIEKLRERQNKINSNNDQISLLQHEIDKVQKEISGLSGQSGDIKQAKKDLVTLHNKKDSETERKLTSVEERTYNEVIGEMLKDTGIKTKVVKQYLPVMNRFINQYLQTFHLDENFNETIRSRHRDTFNYASFSEGEKQRIDLSLLFTWRQIAKMKNSAATNLLILDETFDSSLDVDGIENLTKILSTLDDDTNVFIISHKGDVLENKFRSKIEFYKDRNFSKIKL